MTINYKKIVIYLWAVLFNIGNGMLKIYQHCLTHWGRVTHICVSDLTSIGSDNGLLPGRHQAIIRTNAGILLTRPLGTNFSEFLVKILIFSFKKMHLKVSSAKRRPFCFGLNELRYSGDEIKCPTPHNSNRAHFIHQLPTMQWNLFLRRPHMAPVWSMNTSLIHYHQFRFISHLRFVNNVAVPYETWQ